MKKTLLLLPLFLGLTGLAMAQSANSPAKSASTDPAAHKGSPIMIPAQKSTHPVAATSQQQQWQYVKPDNPAILPGQNFAPAGSNQPAIRQMPSDMKGNDREWLKYQEQQGKTGAKSVK